MGTSGGQLRLDCENWLNIEGGAHAERNKFSPHERLFTIFKICLRWLQGTEAGNP